MRFVLNHDVDRDRHSPMTVAEPPNLQPEAGQWLEADALIAGVRVDELRWMYKLRLRRDALFPDARHEESALHAIAMMDQAHSADFDD